MGLRVKWLDANLSEQSFLTFLWESLDAVEDPDDAEIFVYSGIQRDLSGGIREIAGLFSDNRRVLVHLSDEKLRHRNAVYSRFHVVFRNYFDPRIAWRRNVLFLPLGWTAAFADNAGGGADSPGNTWSFCGAVKADRETMVNVFDSISQGFHHFSSGWDSPDQIAPEIVRDIYEDSIFVLCPQGNAHVDTFRVMEAL